MFAEERTDEFYAVKRKRVASLLSRVQDSRCCVLKIIADRCDYSILKFWVDWQMASIESVVMCILLFFNYIIIRTYVLDTWHIFNNIIINIISTWRWAGYVAGRVNGRWTKVVTERYPIAPRCPRGRPDDIVEVAWRLWMIFALDRLSWYAKEEA